MLHKKYKRIFSFFIQLGAAITELKMKYLFFLFFRKENIILQTIIRTYGLISCCRRSQPHFKHLIIFGIFFLFEKKKKIVIETIKTMRTSLNLLRSRNIQLYITLLSETFICALPLYSQRPIMRWKQIDVSARRWPRNNKRNQQIRLDAEAIKDRFCWRTPIAIARGSSIG